MTNSAHQIDGRNAAAIAKQVRGLLASYAPEWKEVDPATQEQDRISAALIGIFSRFAEIVIQRLNRVPEKNFLAFLNLLGNSLLPPEPARAPLTFYLAEGSPLDGVVVPAGTQVAAAPAEGEKDPVIFETEQEFVINPAQFVSLFVHDPEQDAFTNYTPILNEAATMSGSIFQGNQQLEHILYIGHDGLLDLPGITKLHMIIVFERDLGDNGQVTWEMWNGKKWEEKVSNNIRLLLFSTASNVQLESDLNADKISSALKQRFARNRFSLTTSAVLSVKEKGKKWVINDQNQQYHVQKTNNKLEVYEGRTTYSFEGMQPIPISSVNSSQSRWLRNRLLTPITHADAVRDGMVRKSQLPIIASMKMQIECERSALPLDAAFAGFAPIDLNKPFFPFGDKPKSGDVLYLANQEAFSLAGAQITLHVNLKISPEFKGQVALKWELGNGQTWDELGVAESGKDTANGFTDTTRAFTKSGEVGFKIPPTPKPTIINGLENYWIRVQIDSGDYGKESRFVEDGSQPGGVRLEPANFTPPQINSIKVDYALTSAEESPERILTYNDFVYDDVTDASLFEPFAAMQDTRPTLYLGFTAPPRQKTFPNRPMSLYARPADLFYEPSPNGAMPISIPRLVWEYRSAAGWGKLVVQDNTESFMRAGLIEFLAPADFVAHQEFELEQYWLRVRWESGEYATPPILKRLLPNTTMASQTVTIRNEVLGSSDASENQKFRTTRKPVLQGPQLQVRERERPSEEEGEDAVLSRSNETALSGEPWVRWNQVTDFYGSGPRDRHYMLDYLTGEITFGNGRNGLIPPRGAGNVRMFKYQTGGGVAGNRPADKITQLKTTVPYVERVTNTEAAIGGAEAETNDSLFDRAPRKIRHGGRPVTVEDYEDLAKLAAPEVARAKCVPLRNLLADPLGRSTKSGAVSVIIVPRSQDAKPLPSLELLQRVQDYLRKHALPTANISVVGPLYLRVEVTLEIALASLAAAGAIEQIVQQKLAAFLHPLTGGLDNAGWDFGRKPHKSDLLALLQAVPSVDHIYSLAVDEIEDLPDLPGVKDTGRFLVYSGLHKINLRLPEA